MAASHEVELDIEELTRLHGLAERPKVKEILAAELSKLKSKAVEPKKESVSPAGDALSTAVRAPAAPTKYYKDITTYAWDQSEKFMKLYVTVNGVHKVPKENVTVEFKNRSFRLRVENVDGMNYQCHVAYLWDDLVPADSYHKVKTDTVLVMLKKAKLQTWAYVTEREDKKKKTPKVEDKKEKDPNESLMEMLKQMYDDGDDEMKRTIAKSFTDSRNKVPEEQH